MIAVVADDLTGAAELGGIGLRYNLKVEINAVVNPQSRADLLIISTNTRSKPKAEAVQDMVKVTKELLQLRPTFIFKKVDSVLRGHVLAEMEAQLQVLQVQRALLVPANPALGRVLSNGEYLVQGQPIHETSFSHDPEFPVSTSSVAGMLGAGRHPLYVQQHQAALPAAGIVVGEATNTADLQAWAKLTDNKTFAAGASGFFTALLDKLFPAAAAPPTAATGSFGSSALYVSGTTFGKSRETIQEVKENGGPVCYMPAAIARAATPTPAAYTAWSQEIVSCLQVSGKAIIAIAAETTTGTAVSAEDLRKKTAKVVQLVFAQTDLQELVLEGGATAFAILKELNFQEFYPIRELAPGVIRMQVGAKSTLCLTLKPGSYAWGSDIWNFSSEKAKV
ncbi:four-carbon acid sugar kinase family protein [Pontibacter qinzhouensis]|uniref:Four-carbon acid sugar kinase family protein n=1 Tax=Pontibacter qinzhouensis TaxID=2603253 RepID=A0A5C8IYM8_9BACT|nr:four-carbon acid sugar kinase family protein [Pontibacter qinzhouensis]TXK26689.1 four-carbon acid sugar kinase family protein [Pontibacter qinzhouensis]